jgi:putative transposase
MTEEELRRNAIERYINGENPKSIYNDLGRTKAWFFKWLKRYQSGDPHWYCSKPKTPRHKPTQLAEVDRQRIIHIRGHLQRQSFAQIGVTAIKWELHKTKAAIPSDRTINRILEQEGLIKKKVIHSQRG